MEAKTNQRIVLEYLITVDTSPFWAIKRIMEAANAEETIYSKVVPESVRSAYVSLTTAQEADVLIALGVYINNKEELLKR